MQAPSTPKGQNMSEHPHYFGTYLNMARHNAYMILHYLTEKHIPKVEENGKLPLEDKLQQAPILNLLVKSRKPDEVYALIGDLLHYFPFLRYQDVLNEKIEQEVSLKKMLKTKEKRQSIITMEELKSLTEMAHTAHSKKQKETEEKPIDIKPDQYAELLKSLLEWMNTLRNYFSHYKTTPKFKFDKADAFYQIYDAALFRLIDKNKQTKRYDYFNQNDIAALERTPKAIKDKSVPHLISPTVIDEKALAYFICLFLEPKYASIFLSRLAGFQKALTVEKMSMVEKAQLKAYTMFCCRLPQPKLESSDIMLDMLNELNRCPNDLYPVLSEDDKDRRFKVDLTAEAALAIAQNQNIPIQEDEDGENTEGGVPQEVVLKRHDDRFPYFALRYFDDTDAFKTLRFHVQLGKLLKKDKYEKVMFGEKRDRELTKPIFTFSKLKPMLQKYEMVNQDDLDNKKIDARFVSKFNETWIEEKNGQTQLKSVIEQFSPHYNFGEQTIGFKIFENPNRMPDQDNNLPRLPNLNDGKKIKGTEPDGFFSTYELRNLFFYQYLYKEGLIQTSAEDFLKEYIDNIQRFFKDVKDGTFKPLAAPPDFIKKERKPYSKDKWERKVLLKEYDERQEDMEERRKRLADKVKAEYNIGYTSIPHDIREYLLAYKTPQYGEYVVKKLEIQVKDVKQRLKDIGKPIVTNGKELSKPKAKTAEVQAPTKDHMPRVGEQATWLAEDILHFMPARINDKDHKQKMNNDQFRILQSSLAYFSSNRDQIWQYFKELGLIHNAEKALQHPFLFKVQKADCPISLDFYEKYLKAKYKYLDELISDLTKKDKQGNIIEYAPQKYIEDNYSGVVPPLERKGRTKSYEGIPVLLPKGLFNEAISMALNKSKKSSYKGEINTVVYSLEQYVNGDTQDFYGYEHYYRMPKIDENIANPDKLGAEGVLRLKSEYVAELEAKIAALDIEKEKVSKQKAIKDRQKEIKDEKLRELKDALRDTHRLKNRILDREQTIRYHQANDRALWLMIKDRQEEADKHLNIDFKDLKLKNLEDILNLSIKVKGKVPRTDTKIVEQLPIRRYGDLRRVLKDRRLANLVTYYLPKTEIEHETIKKEFERYDLRREKFFATIYAFERDVYTWFKYEFDPQVLSSTGFYDHNVFMEIATNHLTDTEMAEHYKNNVKNLRNKFLHNEIPYFDWLTKEVENESKSVYICDNIFEVSERYYKNLLKLIKPK